MTQKELLYIEDAINHEKSIISICEEAIGKLNSKEFVSFMEDEITKHETIKEELMMLLRGKVNE